MNRLLISLALLLAVLGIGALGTQIGTTSLTFPQPIGVEQASAACSVGPLTSPHWVTNGYKGSNHMQGCGTITLQVCIQSSGGTVYACNTYNGSGFSVTVYSLNASSFYGCTQRTWSWNSVFGTFTSAYAQIC